MYLIKYYSTLTPLPKVYSESVLPFTGNVAALAPKRDLSPGDYYVLMRIYDVDMLYQESSLDVEVCHCQGAVSSCFIPRYAPQLHISSVATSVLGTVSGALCMYSMEVFFYSPLCPKFVLVHSLCLTLLFFSLLLNHSTALTTAVVAEKE